MSRLDDFIEECLQEHNKRRQLHGAPPLKHSRSLDKSAQDWCEELISEDSVRNSPLSSRGDVGESISMRTSTSSHVDIQGAELVAQWYADIKNYNFVTGKGPAGNFTQLIWNATREVGFGKTRSAGKCIVVAHYRPPGNIRGRYLENVSPPISETGPVSSDSEKSSTDPTEAANRRSVVTESVKEIDGKKYTIRREVIESSKTNGRVKRCVNESYSDFAEHEKSLPTADMQRETEAGSEQALADESTVQLSHQEEFSKTVVRAHNAYRELHGSSDLKLDRELSQMAQNWAQHLINQTFLSNSGTTYQGIRLGENIFSRWSNASVQVTAQQMVDHWYQEMAKYKFAQEPNSVQGIGSFTQLIWSGSQRIGVGFATQPKLDADGEKTSVNVKFIGVCLYHPPGNVMGKFKANVKPLTA